MASEVVSKMRDDVDFQTLNAVLELASLLSLH